MKADCPQFNGHTGRNACTVRTQGFQRIDPVTFASAAEHLSISVAARGLGIGKRVVGNRLTQLKSSGATVLAQRFSQ
jgi:hypothetical protein